MKNTRTTKSRFITGGILLGAAAFVLFTLCTMWLWNWLMPTIFSLSTITFWQAAGILALSKILFSGGHWSRQWQSDRRHKFWHRRFEEKWGNISDEKKEHFAQQMDEKFGKKQAEE